MQLGRTVNIRPILPRNPGGIRADCKIFLRQAICHHHVLFSRQIDTVNRMVHQHIQRMPAA